MEHPGNGKGPDRRDLDILKRTLSLVDVASSYGLAVKAVSGNSKNHVAPCPFHADKEASLSIHTNDEGKWLWSCFGCKTGGDAVSFIQLYDKIDFKAALAKLRSLAGLLPTTPADAEVAPPPTRELPPGQSRHELLTAVMTHYQQRFADCPEAQAYLDSRGLGAPELRQTFGLGYADGSLLPTLPRNGDVRHGLAALGVLNEYGREHFKGCVVVPLFHPDDGLVGLYGRRIDGEARRRHLYLPGPQRGVLNWQALQTAPVVHLTEGVLDALSLWTAGVSDVSCVFSAQGVPQDLDDLLRRYTVRQVRLCLDADGPGRDAAARFHAELEARGVAVSRVELPEKDANQLLVQRGAEALKQAVHKTTDTKAQTRTPVPVQTCSDQPDSFTLEMDDVRYQVTARPPFTSRLRVLLKAWHGNHHHPETLDLYNGRNRTMTVNALHRVFGVDKGTLETHLLKLLEATEQWLAQQSGGGAALAKAPAPVALSETEREEALAYLTRPDLVPAILADMDALGAVGEEDAKLMVYLIGTSRKQDKPLAGVVLSQSGAGKSSLIQLAQVLMPPEDVVYYSRVSATAPGYMDRYAVKHKLLMFDERSGSEAADYQIRSLLSQGVFKQGITTKDPLTGKMTVVENEVEGPIAFLETTTLPEINDENASRVFELTMTETEAQTARIHAHQRWSVSPEGLAQRYQKEAICRRHHLAQRLLEQIPVAVPFWNMLTFPTRWLRTRRDHARFLNLILSAAYLHQFQRPRGVLADTGEVYVEASVDDYRLAYQLAKTVLSATLHDLPQSCQELWVAARAMLALRTKGGKVFDEVFTRRELRVHTGWPDRRLRENLEKLVELEYVGATAGSQGKTYQYHLLPGGDEGAPLAALLTPDALEALIAARKAA